MKISRWMLAAGTAAIVLAIALAGSFGAAKAPAAKAAIYKTALVSDVGAIVTIAARQRAFEVVATATRNHKVFLKKVVDEMPTYSLAGAGDQNDFRHQSTRAEQRAVQRVPQGCGTGCAASTLPARRLARCPDR